VRRKSCSQFSERAGRMGRVGDASHRSRVGFFWVQDFVGGEEGN